MLALSQATTERLLAEALEEFGGKVERGIKLVECRNTAGGVEAVLEPSAGGHRKVVAGPWLLGADGAHSTVRGQLGIDFAGSSMPGEWYLADVPLKTPLAGDQAHIFFLEGGAFLFMIRVVDPALESEYGQTIWRVISARPDPFRYLVTAEQAGPPIWESGFRISHRIGSALSAGRVYLAGDAAHIHSPIGARGMNLGIEDAKVFSELALTDRLTEYNRLRRSVDIRVVRRVVIMSRFVASESFVSEFLRMLLFKELIKVPLIRSRFLEIATGLDHPLPQFVAGDRTGKVDCRLCRSERLT